MICPQCGKTDIRWFEHVEQHRVIEKEANGILYLSRSFPQDDSVVKAFLECTICGWTVTEDEVEKELKLKVEMIGD